MNRAGKIVTSTVSSAYPEKVLQSVGKEVLVLLREARAAQMPMAEISIHFAQPAHHCARTARRRDHFPVPADCVVAQLKMNAYDS